MTDGGILAILGEGLAEFCFEATDRVPEDALCMAVMLVHDYRPADLDDPAIVQEIIRLKAAKWTVRRIMAELRLRCSPHEVKSVIHEHKAEIQAERQRRRELVA